MLGIRRGELGKERADGPGLPHDLLQGFGAQELHHRLGEMDLIHFFQGFALFYRLRAFYRYFFLFQDL